jgi:hypothetical protein
LCYDLIGIGIDDENAGPGHRVFLRKGTSRDAVR